MTRKVMRARKKKRTSSIPSTVGNANVFRVRQSVLTQVNVPSTASYFGALSFALTDLGNATPFANVWDQYRLTKVKCHFLPQYTNYGPISSSVQYGQGQLITVLDYDDAIVPTALTTLLSYDTCRVQPFSKPVVRTLVPHIAMAAYAGGTFTSSTNESRQWIDMNSPSVPHYGVKYMVNACDITTQGIKSFFLWVEYFIEMRNAR